MIRPNSSNAAAALVLLCILGTPVLRCAEEKPAPPPGNGAAPASPDAPPAKPGPQDPAPAPTPPPSAVAGNPAGLVRFPGGKAKIGIDRKALEALIKATELGRMSNQQKNIEDGYTISCPEFEVTLPPYWIGKYEVTNAQWHRFLQSPEVRMEFVIPEKGKPGAATLEQISRLFLLGTPFPKSGGGLHYPAANDWRTIYDLNEEAINPVVAGQDPKTRPAPETFRDRTLPPGTKIVTYRWSVPLTWRAKPGAKVQSFPPPWMEEMPVSKVSWSDATAFAEYYGCHVPTEQEWEAACRGPKGELWPEGGAMMDPLAHAWKGFNGELLKAQEEVKKNLAAAQKRLGEAKTAAASAEAKAEVDRLEAVQKMREFPEDPPFTIVGSFPRGRSPCGAMDMIGNVEEWVSTVLCRYPNTDTKSLWADADAHILKGGNTIYRDSLLTCAFRAILDGNLPLMSHMTFSTAGFRVARYEAPGASAASHLVGVLRASSPPILPREEEKGTHRIVGPDLDVYRAAGIERYQEVSWTAAGSPGNDPAGKVFYLGQAQSLAVLPATGTPFRDAGALRDAAMRNPVPPAAAEGVAKVDNRQPRDIPFLGILHITKGVDVKGEILAEEIVDVAYTPKERKKMLDDWKAARQKKKEEDPPKDDGKDPPKKMFKGGDPKGGGAKPGDKPADPNAPPDGDKPDGDNPEPKEGEPNIPKTHPEKRLVHKQGFLKGADHPDGLLLGFLKVGEEARAVLWEPRLGTVGSTAPGGTVMLEHPLVILPKECIEFKKVGKPGNAETYIKEPDGDVRLKFFLPVEGKESSAWIEVILKLQVDYSSDWKGGPWVMMFPK